MIHPSIIVIQQELNVGELVLSCDLDWLLSILVILEISYMAICSCNQESSDYFCVALDCCQMKRRLPFNVLWIKLYILLREKILCYFLTASISCPMQRCTSSLIRFINIKLSTIKDECLNFVALSCQVKYS